MKPVAFEAATRRVADGVTRRGALTSLAGAGLAAAFAQPLSVTAKKDSAKKAKKQANKRCQNQVAQCVGWLEAKCADEPCDPEGEENFRACCQYLGQCNAQAFIECIV
jgi:hypothetical protein